MIRRLASVVLTANIFLVSAVVAPAQTEPGTSQQQDWVGRYEGAFNSRDVETLRSMWLDDAVYVDESTATTSRGAAAIVEQLEAVFADQPSIRLSIKPSTVEVVDGVRRVSGTTELNVDGESPSRFAFEAELIEHDGRFRIRSVIERDLKPSDAPEFDDPLEPLRWLVGNWTSEKDADAFNRFEMMPGGGFLVRTFGVGDQTLGYQIIGPALSGTGIRSHTFLGDGGRGVATWEIEDDRVLVHSRQVTADRSLATGTYVLRRADDDTLTVKVVGHRIDGEPVPVAETVTLIRNSDLSITREQP